MGPEYWAGLATGVGIGTTIGLGVALAVALWPQRPPTPNEPKTNVERGQTWPQRASGG